MTKEAKKVVYEKSVTNEDKERVRAIMEMYHSGDDDKKAYAIELILKEVEGFIGHMINKHVQSFKVEHYHDMYNECVVAILEVIDKFDPDEGTLTTYLTLPVKHALMSYVNGVTNRSSSYYSGIMNKVRKAIVHFEKQNHHPSVAAIAYYTGLSMNKVEDALSRINAANEMHYSSHEELESQITEFMKTPEDGILEKERSETLASALRSLPENDRDLLLLRVGTDGKPRSYATIAKMRGIPTNQVASSIARCLRQLADNKELAMLCGDNFGKAKRRASAGYDQIALIPSSGTKDIYAELDEFEEEVAKVREESDELFVIAF